MAPLILAVAPFIYEIYLSHKELTLFVVEFIAYYISITIATQAIYYDNTVSHFVAFLGVLLLLASFFYSTFLYAPKNGGREREFGAIVGAYIMLTFSPLAIVYQSTLLGTLHFFQKLSVLNVWGK